MYLHSWKKEEEKKQVTMTTFLKALVSDNNNWILKEVDRGIISVKWLASFDQCL